MVEVNPNTPLSGTMRDKAVRRKYKKGEKILRPYDEPKQIFTVIEGYVKAYSINDQGGEQIQSIYGNLEFFPVAWMVGNDRIRLYFEALTDCVVDVLPQEYLHSTLRTNPEVSYVMLCKMVDLFMTYAAQINNLEHTYASERLAYRLLIFADRFGEQTEDGIVLPPFSYQTIGSTINLSRESVNREMAKLSKQGLVLIKKSHIYLTNVPGLKKKIDREGTNLILEDLAFIGDKEH
jgi:CRP-like cAMP-binding protein